MVDDALVLGPDGPGLSFDDVLSVARGGRRVELAAETRALLAARRRQVVDYVAASGTPHYGFNRGFGHNQKVAVSPEATAALQVNLIRSHAAGVGEPAPADAVRAAMLLRAASLARGHSGVRPELVERLLELLNADVVPLVPRFGSVGASGDLAPLSHIALAILGEGRVLFRGEVRQAADVQRELGLPPVTLEMKEGLALNNGMQFTCGLGFVALDDARRLLETAALATSLSVQVMLGSDTPFRADLHALRPHPGARLVAAWVWQLMQGSPMREFHRRVDLDGEVQDPYSLRCAAQVLGAGAELLEDARRTLEIEASSVTDNPILLPLTDATAARLEWGTAPAELRARASAEAHAIDIVSGGHFHGMPIAVKLYGLVQAMAIAARLSNMRVARYVDEDRNKGLGSDLIWTALGPAERSISSALMIPEYVSAALTNWIWGASMPSHLLSVSTDAGQEDHVSMAAGVAVRIVETLPRLAEVLAVELACAAQAAAVRKAQEAIPSRVPGRASAPWSEADRRLSPPGEAVVARIQQVFPLVTEDRVLSDDLSALARLVLSGDLVTTAAAALAERGDAGCALFPSWEAR